MKSARPLPVFLALVLAVSCASAPQPSAQAAPDWIIKTPPPDGTYTYFVGSGSSAKGDSSEALNDATAKLISNIMVYLGVKVSADTTAVAKASLDSYQTDIVSTVTTQSTNRLVGFMVKERKETKDKASGRVMVYILASYDSKELAKEKARIEALFKEKNDAVAKPEGAGMDAEGKGRQFDAIRFYIEAAVAASGSDIENAEIKMERNVNNARRVIQKIRFVKATNPPIPQLNQDFSAPFSAKLVYGESDSSPGVPGVEIVVQYPKKQGPRVGTKTDRAVSDPEGMVKYTPPAPDSVGKMKVTMRVNLDSSLDLLARFPPKYVAYREALETELKGRIITFEYLVGSVANTVPMAIAIVDLDKDGAVTGTVAQGGLIETLVKGKYRVQMATLDEKLVISLDDRAVLAAAKAALAGKAVRLVYGVVRIEAVTREGTTFMASAKATIRVLDLETGTPLYFAEKNFSAIGDDDAAARRNVLAAIGRETIARDLMSNLP
ncbi:MAG: hypothetical protein NT080_03090 [Spirochaetes bacterium]|nr:hypothetical protein [Spirochaetota bacterium]